jgi:UDP-N-acetylmuramoylalanine--D-glutamate ligase
MARSGVAAALAARRVEPEARITICDRDETPAGAGSIPELEEADVIVAVGREDNSLLDGCDLVIKSPGVPNEVSLLREARQRGIRVIGEVEFAWRYLENMMVGVTGTNGKTTTTEMIGYIISQSGRSCSVAGNVGMPLSSLVGTIDDDAVIVAELSSFQLEDSIDFRPDVAVLLNLTEDHLDRHPGLDHYFSSKVMIFANQGSEDVAVLNSDDRNSHRPIPGQGRHLWFSRVQDEAGRAERPLIYFQDGFIRADIDAVDELSAAVRSRAPWNAAGYRWSDGRNGWKNGEKFHEGGRGQVIEWSRAGLKGEHNLENSLAATAACLSLGLTPGEIAAGIGGFPGVAHRLQEVGIVGGVTYVNDSKATNTDAAVKALTAYRSGIHLILGGSSKGCSFDELASAATRDKVKQVYVIGESAPEIAASFANEDRQVVQAGRLAEAVAAAHDAAETGDVVLFSPACASFDQYKNFEERGRHFISLVEGLAKEKSEP